MNIMVEKARNKPNMAFQELLELLGQKVVLGCKNFLPGPAWLLLSKTGPLLPVSILSTHFEL